MSDDRVLSAADPFSDAISQDFSPQRHLLLLGRQWEYLVEIFASFLQPSHRRDHTILHCGVCVHGYLQARSVDDLCCLDPSRHGSRSQQQGECIV